MKEIDLTDGSKTIIDDADASLISGYTWRRATSNKEGKLPLVEYAVASRNENGEIRTYLMHRLIMGLEIGDKRQVDHIDNNGLNNARSNLRICSHFDNAHNARKREGTSSKFKGVIFDKVRKKWRAEIMVNRKRTYLGRFNTEELAAEAYKAAAFAAHGDFLNLGSKSSPPSLQPASN